MYDINIEKLTLFLEWRKSVRSQQGYAFQVLSFISETAILWSAAGVAGAVAAHLVNCGVHELRNCCRSSNRNAVQPIGNQGGTDIESAKKD